MGSFDFFADRDAIYARKDLSPLEKHLAVVILSFRNADTGQCNPPIKSDFIKEDGSKVEDIVDRSGMSERAIQNNLNSLEKKAVLLRTRRWNAASDITFIVTPQEMHPAGDAPRTTCTLTPQEMHPQPAPDAPRRRCTPHQMHPHPAGDAPSPRTRCGLTDKEQIKNREEISSAHTCEEPPFDDDLFDEAIRVVETEATSESPPEKKQKKPRKARTSVTAVERPNDLPEQLWQDWLELRKAKRAPLNTTTINTFRAEAQKAGISFEEAVSFSVANGYQGFKADWYRKNASTFTNGRPHQGYAGFGARNTAEINYTAGID
ncbi:helix-turn-helix domain-containing protein [Sutterella wadsworthensis]|uniref:helix-turn-helix domain-containing protein n=1 Tax=Sutterella wadsworthensis TaxID=40545 RepID=UPI003A8F4B26